MKMGTAVTVLGPLSGDAPPPVELRVVAAAETNPTLLSSRLPPSSWSGAEPRPDSTSAGDPSHDGTCSAPHRHPARSNDESSTHLASVSHSGRCDEACHSCSRWHSSSRTYDGSSAAG